jgi:hypothetical protein
MSLGLQPADKQMLAVLLENNFAAFYSPPKVLSKTETFETHQTGDDAGDASCSSQPINRQAGHECHHRQVFFALSNDFSNYCHRGRVHRQASQPNYCTIGDTCNGITQRKDFVGGVCRVEGRLQRGNHQTNQWLSWATGMRSIVAYGSKKKMMNLNIS